MPTQIFGLVGVVPDTLEPKKEGDVCLVFLRHSTFGDIADIRNKKGMTPMDVCATDALRRRIFLIQDDEPGNGNEDIA